MISLCVHFTFYPRNILPNSRDSDGENADTGHILHLSPPMDNLRIPIPTRGKTL